MYLEEWFSSYPDKGTFNYRNAWPSLLGALNSINFGPVVIGGHAQYDMKTYEVLMKDLNLKTEKTAYKDIGLVQ
jgi:hypothetical protein